MNNRTFLFQFLNASVLIIVLIFCTSLTFAQNVEILGGLKINTLEQDNTGSELLVKRLDGTIGLRDAASLPSSAVPQTGIILSTISPNTELINAGFKEIGKQIVPFASRLKGSWTATSESSPNLPAARQKHTAVWTDSEMIVWGGTNNSTNYDNGGIYNPVADTWSPIANTNSPLARNTHTAVWTGSEMIIWGGLDSGGDPLGSGKKYSPATNTWINIANVNVPTDRSYHTAVWTGTEMIIWGGYDNTTIFGNGAKYNPATNTWTSVSNLNAPVGRIYHTAVWTGTEMIIWGGVGGGGALNDGAKYNPSTNTWSPITNVNSPVKRSFHTAVWTGEKMIIWGGSNSGKFNSGGLYDPISNSWTPTSLDNAPVPRDLHTAVWTGSEMIIWGGAAAGGPPEFPYGKMYNPSTDQWTVLDGTNEPLPRAYFSSVWDGSQMIVWGGTDYLSNFSSGGKLDPSILGAYAGSSNIEFYLYIKE